jgi:hypothetical protein
MIDQNIHDGIHISVTWIDRKTGTKYALILNDTMVHCASSRIILFN